MLRNKKRILDLFLAFNLALIELMPKTGVGADILKDETVIQYIDSSVITAKVKAALFGTPKLKSTAIMVETYKSVVSLYGNVDSVFQSELAEQIAKEVTGVHGVKNILKVHPPETYN